ncbi:hypothetical protein K438DRAFT_1748095 [Mycena galopus ATCC 62051]|nr:hypothetical protein K438DRAFT_1748095 [Mycena galopus ATCC 62051]
MRRNKTGTGYKLCGGAAWRSNQLLPHIQWQMVLQWWFRVLQSIMARMGITAPELQDHLMNPNAEAKRRRIQDGSEVNEDLANGREVEELAEATHPQTTNCGNIPESAVDPLA